MVTAALILKLAVALGLGAAILLAALARAPRRSVAPRELGRVLTGALALYAAGVAALIAHRGLLTTLSFAGGVLTATLAAWLARGTRPDDPDGPEAEAPPPPGPEARRPLDWGDFDRERSAWERPREPAAR